MMEAKLIYGLKMMEVDVKDGKYKMVGNPDKVIRKTLDIVVSHDKKL